MPLLKTMTGDISYKSEQGVLTALVWGEKYKDEIGDEKLNRELAEYFNGQLQGFSLDVLPSGTDYQKKVWQALLSIPYGQTVTYQDIARDVDSHPRAVGTAVGKNPIPVVIPCHRVVGKNGQLTGFSGGKGLTTKKQLLDLEKMNVEIKTGKNK